MGSIVRCLSKILFRKRTAFICLLMSVSFMLVYYTESMTVQYVPSDDGISTMALTIGDSLTEVDEEPGTRLLSRNVDNFPVTPIVVEDSPPPEGFAVAVYVDGLKRVFTANNEMTVDNLLEDNDIYLRTHDTISLPTNYYLVDGDEITIERIDYIVRVEEEVIPFETDYRQNSLIRSGRSEVLTRGVTGLKEVTYTDKVVDGVVVNTTTDSETIISEPSPQLTLIGGSEAISDLDFGYELDENGVPTEYVTVYSNQIATGYSGGKGTYGASGDFLYYGYVAVRADEIPYGTKMYITSADNSFVYGYAIAADTGIGLMDYVIDIDLYYETFRESQLNERRIVNIYILE